MFPMAVAAAVITILIRWRPRLAALCRTQLLRNPSNTAVYGPTSATLRALLMAPRRARRDRSSVDQQLPDVVEAVARSLRSGTSLRVALAEGAQGATGSLAVELRGVHDTVTAGASLPEALDGWAARHRPCAAGLTPADRSRRGRNRARSRIGHPALAMTATVLAIAAEVGGAQARTVDALVASLRDQRAVIGEIRTAAAQARLSAVVMVLLPIGFAALQAVTNGAAAHFLLATAPGGVCLLVGLTLDALGAWWMRRLVRAP